MLMLGQDHKLGSSEGAIDVWEKIKEWVWIGLIAIAAFLGALLSKPKWVKEKEKEIKVQDKEIEQAKGDAKTSVDHYEEVKADHDKTIEQAETGEDSPNFNDPDSAASFIDDILGKRK